MAIRKAGESAYKVYEQSEPIFIGKDAMGNNQYRANLIERGFVMAIGSNRAFELARDYCQFPVLEKYNGTI